MDLSKISQLNSKGEFMKITMMITALTLLATSNVFAQSATGTAKLSIIQGLNVTNTSDLNFGELVQGDTGSKSVTAGDSESANFTVAGQANATYNIILPSAAITMTNGAGGANKEIEVDSFASDKLGNSSSLDVSGADAFNVGATTAALTGSEEVGDYTGNFTVTVAY